MACSPSTLPGLATCFSCIPEGYKPTANLYLLNTIVGGPTDPQALESLASRFAQFYGGWASAVKAYLLAVIAGGSTDPKVLANLASSFTVYVRDPDGQSNAEAYLWAQLAGITNTQTIITNSAPYQRVRGDEWKIELYLLAQRAGITDPQTISQNAACFLSCLSPGGTRDVIIYLLCQISNAGGMMTLGQTTANAWALRVVANGGAMPSQASINAAATFVDTLNNAGIWSKMLDVNMFAPDSLTACLTPLLITDGLTLWTNTNFVAGDLSVNGLQGSAGGGKFLSTGINISPKYTGTPPTIFIGATIYVSGGIDGAFCEYSWIQNNYSLYCGFTGTCFFDNFGTVAGRLSVANANWLGFLSGSRTSYATSSAYKASSTVPFVQIATTNANNTNQGAFVTPVIFVFANNNGANAPLQVSSRRLSFAAHHLGLISSETQTLFNAVQALRVAFGGGFA